MKSEYFLNSRIKIIGKIALSISLLISTNLAHIISQDT